ncbi:MAG: tRNA 5-methoxyuridine(34)/uridine 5-oxyacetic acid(34) synthase CmoB [Opitutales bacterium]|nr:tRNA 5-methoxyuridine(34)/uridine 5-oxyacetic acid(34) synthase CmoB [Opitutales bacterium]
MFDYRETCEWMSGPEWRGWGLSLAGVIEKAFEVSRNGHLGLWQDVFRQLPVVGPCRVDLDSDWVRVVSDADRDPDLTGRIRDGLMALMPWRKGPFEVCGVRVDAEWRSCLKWNRVCPHLNPLKDRLVLDVGCGNGYYAMRMIGGGAQAVVGVEPYLRSVVQHQAVMRYAGPLPVHILPMAFEQMPQSLQLFDTVFSMGVLYHQRSPLGHIEALGQALKPGGELVLETLVVDGTVDTVLTPEDRYSKMRNVWFIPSALALERWLKRCGFRSVRIVDVTPTGFDEQRRTDWMPYESLEDFVDRQCPDRTVEGYPAPVRGVVIAEKP